MRVETYKVIERVFFGQDIIIETNLSEIDARLLVIRLEEECGDCYTSYFQELENVEEVF